MSPEITAGIIGAVVGSLAAYVLGWNEKVGDDRRRRKSIASALIWEFYPLANSLDTLRRGWQGQRVSVELPSTALDAFPEHAELFEPTTVCLVLDLLGSIRDIRNGMNILNTMTPVNPAVVQLGIREISSSCLGKIYLARDALKAEGGRLPQSPPWPSGEQVESLMRDVAHYLKP